MCQPLLTPEAARARASLDREELAALLDEVSRFVRAHPAVVIRPPWKTTAGMVWEVNVGGMTAAYENPEFMMSQLAERWGYTDDLMPDHQDQDDQPD